MCGSRPSEVSRHATVVGKHMRDRNDNDSGIGIGLDNDIGIATGNEIEPSREVEVRTSNRRKKTASGFWQDGRMIVVVPARMGLAQRDEVIENLTRRLMARRPFLEAGPDDLLERVERLAARYLDGVRPTSVRWVSNQNHRWGSCTSMTGEIRVSERLRPVPKWVLDAVLVHELAHLIEPTHSERFARLVARYPRSREADAFLAGYALGLETRDRSAAP